MNSPKLPDVKPELNELAKLFYGQQTIVMEFLDRYGTLRQKNREDASSLFV